MKNEIRNFKDLIVWQKSVNLSIHVYHLTKSFPDGERFGLTSQIRRCAVSVASNIAEGKQRSTTKDYVNFLKISRGSLAELETQLIIAEKLRFVEKTSYNNIAMEIEVISKMLNAMIGKLSGKAVPNPQSLTPNP